MRIHGAVRAACLILVAYITLPLTEAVDVYHSARAHRYFLDTLEHFSSKHEKERVEAGHLFEDMRNRRYALGDMWGLREDMADNGLVLNVSFAMNWAGNPVGGRSQGVTQLNSTGISFAADLEKLAGLEGLTFFSSLSVRSGTSLTLKHIGNVINVQQLYGNESYRLVNLYLEQVMLNEHVGLKVGRIAQFDDFSHAQAFGYYMNNAFDGQPIGFFFIGPFTAYPVTTWGALLRGGFLTDENAGFYGMAGAYGADGDQGNVDNHGTNFTFNFDQGANVMMEIGYKHDWNDTRDGMPGKWAIGGWFFTGPFPSNAGGRLHQIGGAYFFGHQNIYREKRQKQRPDEDKPLTPRLLWGTAENFLTGVEGLFFWTTGQFNATPEASRASWFYSAGLYYRGLIPGRDKDVLSFGMAYLNFSDEWAASQVRRGRIPQDYEVELELSYRYSVTDYFYLQPNVQGILNPGATGTLDDAFVIGLQLQVDF